MTTELSLFNTEPIAPMLVGLNTNEPAPKVCLSFGLGTDSSAVLLRWLTDPASRDFDLADLAVVVAQTGDERASTGADVEELVLPLLREHRVRFIEVARAGRYVTKNGGGVKVLADTRDPQRLHLSGGYTLSQEMHSAGTVPQLGGSRLCSVNSKGSCLDAVISAITQGRPYRHVLGFEANELIRADKDTKHNTELRTGEYPLIEWGWDRDACMDFITATVGRPILKSCCTFCPFALASRRGRAAMMDRYAEVPEEAVDALFMEYVAQALNANQTLISESSLYDELAASGRHQHVLAAFDARLDQTPHALYEVRRILRPKANDPTKLANAARSVRRLATGTRTAMLEALADHADGAVHVEDDGPHTRIYRRRRGATLPTTEQLYTVAPAVAIDKELESFPRWWAEAVAPDAGVLALHP